MNPTRHIYAIAGLVTILSAISLSSTHMRGAAAPSNPQPVVVTNGSGNPVPISVNSLPAVQIGANNTVTVGNQPTVNIGANNTVTVGNTPTVNVGANQTIGIDNPASNPVPVQEVNEPARTPIRFSNVINLSDNYVINQGFFYTVPSGKRLVIQSIFCAGRLPSGEAFVSVRLNEWPLPINDRGSMNGTEFEDGLANITASYDSSTQLWFFVDRNGQSGAAEVDLGFSGYLVDAP